jgi:hypothetical protein
VAQMKSSDQAKPVSLGVHYPRMDPATFEKLCEIRDLPAFFAGVYINEDGQVENFFELRVEFPKELVLPAMLEMLRRYKEELLDKFKGAPDQEEILSKLRELAGVEKPKLKVVKADD